MRGWITRGACLVVLTACGRIGFDPLRDAGESGPTPDAPEVDADDTPVVCPASAFGPAMLAPGMVNTDADDNTPEIEPDGLALWTSVDMGGNEDLYRATRSTIDGDFSAPQLVTELESSGEDIAPCFFDRGNGIIWVSTRNGQGREFHQATRPPGGGPFENLTLHDELGTGKDPTITPDGLTIYFADNRSGGPGGEDLFVATRASVDEPFDPPEPVPVVNTGADDRAPFIAADGLTLLFASDRGGGNYSLYYATRGSTSETFGAAVRMDAPSSSGYEDDPSTTADGRFLFFVSARDSNPSGMNAYVSENQDCP